MSPPWINGERAIAQRLIIVYCSLVVKLVTRPVAVVLPPEIFPSGTCRRPGNALGHDKAPNRADAEIARRVPTRCPRNHRQSAIGSLVA